jgi:3-hydroxyacyl-CoA dehydrogenase/enoyl-CoA hydratase/3-hydroxybutyryl-CoA epimerase
MPDCIRCEIDDDGVATVRINRPHKSVNALNEAMRRELSDAIAHVSAANGVIGIILASDKPTTFLAGADLAELQSLNRTQLDEFVREGQQLLDRIEQLKVPTVAAINGHCLGGGLELALACRCRVVADLPQLLIGLPEVALALIPAWGGTVRLPQLIGLQQAAPLILTGAKLSPREALDAGIVDSIVQSDQLMAAARALVSDRDARHSSRQAARCEANSGLSDFEAIEIAKEEAFKHEDLPLGAIDRLAWVLTRGAADPLQGFAAEHEVFLDLMERPESRERLSKFATRK